MGHSARRELLAKGSDATFLREMIGFAARRLMELETESLTGAVHGERSSDRQVQRNGYRKRDLHTRAGTMELRIPRLRKGPLAFSIVSPAGKRVVTERLRKSVKAGLSPSPNNSRASTMGEQAGCAVQPACRSAANTMARRARRVRRRGSCRC